jgi:hypothetical protein
MIIPLAGFAAHFHLDHIAFGFAFCSNAISSRTE